MSHGVAQHAYEAPSRTCRGCGCTDEAACPGGCAWVEPEDVCTKCALGELLQRFVDDFTAVGKWGAVTDYASVAEAFLVTVGVDSTDAARWVFDRAARTGEPLLYGAGGEVLATSKGGRHG